MSPPAAVSQTNVKDRIMLIRYNMPKDANMIISVFVLNSQYNNDQNNDNRLYFYGDRGTSQRESISSLISYLRGLAIPVSALYVGVEPGNDLNAKVFIDFLRNTWRFEGGQYDLLPYLGTIQLHNRTLIDFLNSETFYFSDGNISGASTTINSCISSGGVNCDQLVCRMTSTLYFIARSKYPRIV